MFHLVLFEPEIPPNTGNVIRLCANTGATLHLVKPFGFRLDDKDLRRSGLDYHDLATVRLHDDFEACLRALDGARVFAVETGAARRYDAVQYRPRDAFVFGPETRGLPVAVLERLGVEQSVFIPMLARNRSINLSNAVAVVAYEAWRQLGFGGRAGQSTGAGPSGGSTVSVAEAAASRSTVSIADAAAGAPITAIDPAVMDRSR
jgi:tRNA (cytidine/uridine-2'-O-)-methyltransferase